MKNRPKLILLLAGIALIAVVLALLRRDKEPTYQGKPLSEWVTNYSVGRRTSREAEQQAAEALRHIGTNGLRFLLAWMDYEPPVWKKQVETLASKMPLWVQRTVLVQRLLDHGVNRAKEATDAFEALGPIGAPAIPSLMRMWGHTTSAMKRRFAMVALTRIGPVAVPALSDLLSNLDRQPMPTPDWGMVISDMGTNAQPLIPSLVPLLESTNSNTRWQCALALSDLRLEPDAAVSALTKELASPNARVREQASWAIARYGSRALSAVPAISQALTDRDTEVRQAAYRALLTISPEAFINAVRTNAPEAFTNAPAK